MGTKHGHCYEMKLRGSASITYNSWLAMKRRCIGANAKYGIRGIRVCDAWMDFRVFLADMGERPSARHTLDRIDNDGHYEPGNVRWATPEIQNNNRGDCRYVTANGITMTLTQWARRLHTSDTTIRNRINDGWSIERAVLTPVKHYRPRLSHATQQTQDSLSV